MTARMSSLVGREEEGFCSIGAWEGFASVEPIWAALRSPCLRAYYAV